MNFPEFASEADYLEFLDQEAALPEGFRAGTASIAFTAYERPTLEPYRMNLGLIMADEPLSSFAGVFTRNAFPGAPVIMARQRMSEETVRGILINNRISNVRSDTGLEDIERLTASLAAASGASPRQLFSVSTGIIGWRLPVEQMVGALPVLVRSQHRGSALDVARSIMTTDRFPKCRRVQLGSGSMVGIAKGAGMIEPDMATMLVFILTDVTVDRATARGCLPQAVDRTFNAITVDGDMSTSDMVLLLSTCRAPAVGAGEFARALEEICGRLALDVVRNGEGVGHVLQVTARELPDAATARGAAKAIANSPLVKTAIYGNDPNVGRILSSLGDYLGLRGISVDPAGVSISVGGEQVFRDGAFRLDREKETRLSDYLKSASLNPRVSGYPQHQRTVEIAVACGIGDAQATVWGADLSEQYVHENADYRS